MNVKSYGALISCILFLAGCTNSPVSSQKAELTKKHNILAYKTPSDNTAKVTIVRDSGMVGGGCDTITYINGTKSLILGSGEKGVLFIPQGYASFSSKFDCPLGSGEQSPNLNVLLDKDIPAYLRVRTDQSSGVSMTETTADNPDFICPDPSKGLDSRVGDNKEKFVEAMRTYSIFFESLRGSARSASVRYNSGELQECLTKNSTLVKSRMDVAFKRLKSMVSNEEEKSALIDAYSKFLATIDSSMSINQINAIKASFNAAVNKYELY